MSDTTTIADQIRAAAYAALLTLAVAPEEPEAEALLPAERITHNRDTELGETEPDGIDLVDGAERLVEVLTHADLCELSFTLQLLRRQAHADSDGVTGRSLSQLRIAAQRALLADPSFGGLAIDCQAGDYTAGPVIGDQLGNLDSATLDFVVLYTTASGDPTQPGG